MYELPLFPLNTVLFPGMPLHLHIFEDRYKLMMQRVMQSNHTFGVNLIKSGMEAGGPNPEPYPTGCTARVVNVESAGEGRLNITVVGDERFRVLRMGLSQPYPVAFVESAPLTSHHSLEVVRGIPSLRSKVTQYLELLSHHSPGPGEDEAEESGVEMEMDLSQIQLPEDPMMLIYLAASLLQIPAGEKQPLIEADTLAELLKLVQRLYRRELAVLPELLPVSEEEARFAAWVN